MSRNYSNYKHLKTSRRMDHAEYPKTLKGLTDDQLLNISRDAMAAIRAFPDGRNAGYYADEISYVSMERKLRERIKAIRERGGK